MALVVVRARSSRLLKLKRAGALDLDVVHRGRTAMPAPPMWNVRIVSCVPGSPIDCAAIDADRLADD